MATYRHEMELRELRGRLDKFEGCSAVPAAQENSNTGHGHVIARPDGVKARCGGPGICHECSTEMAALKAAQRRQGE